MDDAVNIDDSAGHRKNRFREIMKSYGLAIAIVIIIVYVVLEVLFVNSFLSRIMIVNIPQTSYPPDVIHDWNDMADRMDEEMNQTFGPGKYVPSDRSYQHPQGPTQLKLTDIAPNEMPTIAIGLIIYEIEIWASITFAVYVLLKLLRKSPGLSLVSAVGCAFLAFIPFMIVSIVLLSSMPVYTIDYSEIVSHSTADLINNLEDDARFQLVRLFMFMGYLCFGILCILTIKASEELDLRQTAIAGGLPVLLYIIYEANPYIMGLLHSIF